MKVNPKQYADLREVPKYTLQEVSFYLDIPVSTVRTWCLGRTFRAGPNRRFSPPLIELALVDPRNPSLSFFNLAEVHVLSAIRRFGRISLQRVRNAIDYLRETILPESTTDAFTARHPLIAYDLFTNGRDLFLRGMLQTINLSKKGQLAFREIINEHLDRLISDQDGMPEQLLPIRHRDTTKKPVAIFPLVGGGQPVTPRKGIRVSVLMNRFHAGESVRDLAEDYGLSEREVREAIEYMEAA